MARCDHCGNDYDKTFDIVQGDEKHTFDSFECAIQVMAPTCAHCDVRVMGHGVEAEGTIYCSAHCAHEEGITELADRV
jgi:hypothetical protein